jgi:S-adenosylmethionine hydrolase
MVVTLLSDFGDVYPASMKGVILNINPQATIVDISHSVPRYDVRAGAFMLMTSARYFPSGTVHIAVVDPGVGTQRRAIAIKAGSPYYGTHYFVGPDNGLLIPAARSIGEFMVYEITNKALFHKEISHTFHGRDIFASVGAHISKEMDIVGEGKRIYDFVDMDFGEGHRTDGSLEGRVIFIDQFGNIVTNISSETVDFVSGDILEFQKKKVIFQSSYGLCKVSEPLILIGSHGYLEIAINKGNAASYFNIKSGDNVIITRGSGLDETL